MGFLFIGDLTCGFIVSREMPRLQKSRQIRISWCAIKIAVAQNRKVLCAAATAAAGIGLFSSRAFKIAAHLDKLVALNFHFL
jgi:hypothetical protein